MNTQLMSKVSICLAAVTALCATTLTAQPAMAQMFEAGPGMSISPSLPSPAPLSGALSNLYNLSPAAIRTATAPQSTVTRQKGMEIVAQANNLYIHAALKQKAGKVNEAIKLYGQCASLRQSVWGEHDPELAKLYSTLASLYKKQGDLQNAETCSRRALSIAVKNGVSINEQRKSLVEVLAAEKKYEEAYSMYRQVVECDERALGANNQVLTSEEVRLAQLSLMK